MTIFARVSNEIKWNKTTITAATVTAVTAGTAITGVAKENHDNT
jgi:hypothetical protein